MLSWQTQGVPIKFLVSRGILYAFWGNMIKNRLEFTNKVLFVIFFAFLGMFEDRFPLVNFIRGYFWLNL
jgi:hypothetical protein